MLVSDFNYDGHNLSDYGFMIGHFSGDEEIENPACEIVFTTQPRLFSKRHSLINAEYESCLTCEFNIYKDKRVHGTDIVEFDEIQDIQRWLNRQEFLTTYFIPANYEDEIRYCFASFNVSELKINNDTVGLHLKMETNAPFFFKQPVCRKMIVTNDKHDFILQDENNDIGIIYPKITVKIKQSGNLEIANKTIGETTIVKNCVEGETLTFLEGATCLVTNSQDHKTIADDFNYTFPAIQNTFYDRTNEISINIPCEVTLEYMPSLK